MMLLYAQCSNYFFSGRELESRKFLSNLLCKNLNTYLSLRYPQVAGTPYFIVSVALFKESIELSSETMRTIWINFFLSFYNSIK